MAQSFERNIAIHIEGVCGVNGTAPDGTYLTFSRDVTNTATHDVDIAAVLTEKPDVLEESLDEYRAEYTVSAADVPMIRYGDLAQEVFPQSEDDPDVRALNASISDTDTTAQITGSTLDNGFYYIGDETIEITGTTGTTGTDWVEYNIARGRGLSTQQAHGAGQLVFFRVPQLVGRLMRVFYLEPDAAESREWTGMIDGLTHTTRSIQLSAIHVLQTLKDSSIGDKRIDFAGKGSVRAFRDSFEGELTFDDASRSFQHDFIDPTPGSTTVIQVGDHLVQATPIDVGAVTKDGKLIISASPGKKLFAARTGLYDVPEEKRSVAVKDDVGIYEVLVHSQEFSHFRQVPQTGAFDASNSRSDLHQEHVLAHALAYMTSTGEHNQTNQNGRYDLFSKAWGMGIPVDAIGLNAWEATMRKYPSDVASEYVLGLDNEPVAIWKWIKEKILIPYDYLIAPNQFGDLVPIKQRRLEIEDGDDLASGEHNAVVVDGEIEFDPQIRKQRIRLTGRWKPPFLDAHPVASGKENTRAAYLLRDDAQEVQYDTFPSQVRAQDNLDRKLEFRDDLPHTASCTVLLSHSTATGYGTTGGRLPGLGQWVRLLDGPPFLGPDGTETDFDSEPVLAVGRLVAVDQRQDQGRWVADISVSLLNWQKPNPVRVVAPAAELNGTTGTDGNGDPFVEYKGTFPSADDNTVPGFLDDDDVKLYTRDGNVWHDNVTRQIKAVDGGNSRIILDSQFNTVEDGLILRCVDEGSFASSTWAGSAYWSGDRADRRYAYIGVTTEPKDVYGR